jgi:chromosome segregation ATPase
MANGVPEHEVFKAADAVLARGERPTVERVRTELGRGSPARVGQLLEQWWEQLAQRLKGHALLPEVPGEVAQAFAEAWRLALSHADTAAQVALREEHNRLFADQAALTQERKLWAIALAEAQATATESAAQLAQSTAQLHERQLLIDQLGAQVTDVQRQRDHLLRELDHRQAELDMLRAEHAAVQVHMRTVEDRAHQQVDRVRQELKACHQQTEREQRDHARVITQLGAQERELRAALRIAEQAAAHQAGRVAALESTVAQWRGRRSSMTPKTSRASAKAPASRPKTRQRKEREPNHDDR